ncbi:MAG: leucyl/phenylalanyl-tRNA--protein transferase [Caulobacteraceae bacterium]
MPAFTPDDLIACYRRGVFPMAEGREDDRIFLVDPEARGVIPLDRFTCRGGWRARCAPGDFQIRVDTVFSEVVERCASPAPGRMETWISRPIHDLYRELFARGEAHSVECWREGRLVGGLYGVSVAAAFFGESMFSIARDASKVALAHLVARLRVGGYRLLDAQFMTEHLAQFGAEEIERAAYLRRLARALAGQGDFYRLPAYAPGETVLEAIGAD